MKQMADMNLHSAIPCTEADSDATKAGLDILRGMKEGSILQAHIERKEGVGEACGFPHSSNQSDAKGHEASKDE